MRYPFLLPSLALIAGIICSAHTQFPLHGCVLILFGLLPLVWLVRGTNAFRPIFLLLLFLLSAINFRVTSIPPSDDISQIPIENSDAMRSTVTGIVAGSVRRIMEGKSVRQTFPLSVRSVRISDKTMRVRGRIQCITYQTQKILRYGDRLRLWGPVSVPKTAGNPGEFDYALYLSRQGVYRQMNTVGEKSVTVLTPGNSQTFGALVEQVRMYIAGRFDSLFDKTESGFLKALLIGDRRDIPFRIQENFVYTGTVHVLSISGLHIAIVGGCWYAFWRILGLPQRLNALLTILVIFIYMQIAGFNIPVIRSALMGALFYAAILIRRESDSLSALFFAVFLLLIVSPLWLWSISFQLSFLCVLSMAIFSPSFEKRLNKIPWGVFRRSFSISAAIMLGVQALVTFYFSTVTPISVIANMLVVPLFTFITIGGFIILPLSYIPWLGFIFVNGLALIIQASIFLNEKISRIPFAYWFVPKPPLSIVLGYYFSLSIIWVFRSWLLRKRVVLVTAGCVGIAVVILGLTYRSEMSLSVTALHVKQAGIYLIRTPENKHILVNSGPARKPDVGRWITIPFLKSRGIRTLDSIIIAGWGKRYWGSLSDLAYFFDITYCLVPATGSMPHGFPKHLGRTEIKKMKNASEITGLGSVRIKSFSSAKGETAILIHWKDKNILIAPNTAEEIWDKFDQADKKERIDAVFIFSKKMIWSPELVSRLNEWKPKIVVISPSARPEIDPNLSSGIAVLYTDENGAVELKVDENKLHLKPFKALP